MELWDLYDAEGRPTGVTWERDSGRDFPEGMYHIVCDILVKHTDGDYLLMQRDLNKQMAVLMYHLEISHYFIHQLYNKLIKA